ncbi:MAG: carboxypeptidase-like regulatory domain-containing protein [Phaeodactylibacter sp.]|nr:carboxypeptidase-like regulatory domain-containing protein [Phaeodactylibacter sp.]
MRWFVFWFCWLFAISLAGQPSPLQQPVNAVLENATLSEALSTLSRENRLKLSYSNNDLPSGQPFSYRFESVPLETALNILLRNTPLVYFPSGEFIIIRELEKGEQPIRPVFYTLSGRVEDAASGERLIGANIYLLGAQRGTATNSDGFFSLSLPADSVVVMVSYIGYETAVRRIGLFGSQELHLRLRPSVQLAEVEVKATPLVTELPVPTADIGRQRMNAATIQSIPAFLGEPDLLQALDLLPGVQSGAANLGSLNIRGASAGHNHILLDGAQIYNPNHMVGLYSVFNASAVKDVELIKGAAPARYGGRLASVLEVNGREGNFYRWTGEAALGMIVSKALVEGPIIREKLSLLVSGRRTYWDVLLSPLFKAIDPSLKVGYHFGDLNVKLKHKLDQRDSWEASFYAGEDRFGYFADQDTAAGVFISENRNGDTVNITRQRYDINLFWKNLAASLKWNRAWNPSIFSRSTLYYSEYRFQLDFSIDEEGVRNQEEYKRFFRSLYYSGVRDLGGRVDVDWAFQADKLFHFGASLIAHQYQPQSGGGFLGAVELSPITGEAPGNQEVELRPLDLRALESGLYGEAQLRFGPWQLEPGFHLAGFYSGRRFWASLQPRMKAVYTSAKGWKYFVLFSQNRQYAHLVGNESINLPTDLWTPSTPIVKPQRAWQASAGVERRWPYVAVTAEAYYTRMSNLTSLLPGSGFAGGQSWEDKVLQGKGENYGLEFFLRKHQGKWTGLLSYHLSWAWRQFGELNQGAAYPFRNNRRHQFALAFNHRAGSRFNWSASWTVLAGNYITVPNRYVLTSVPSLGGSGERPQQSVASLSELINNFQTPLYHRLDVSFDFIKRRRAYFRKWSIGFFNAYNRRNPTFYYDEFNGVERKLIGIALFPLIPSVSYQMKF